MRDLTRTAAAIAAAALLAACGGDKGAPKAAPSGTAGSTGTAQATQAAPAADACTLLTDAEVAAALGGAAKAEASSSGAPLRSRLCTWATATTPPRTFTLNVTTTAGLDESVRKNGMTARSMYDSTKTAYAGQSGVTPLPGLGDEAFRAATGVMVLKGDVFLSSTTAFGDSAAANKALLDLTAKAVARL